MPDIRECLALQAGVGKRAPARTWLPNAGWRRLFEDELGQCVLIGGKGAATSPARLHWRDLGRWVEVAETWDFDVGAGELNPAGYKYAVFDSEPEAGVDPRYRWELHPFSAGRTRAIYGHSSFAHLHRGNERDHVPTGYVSIESFLRYVIAEGTDVAEDDAARLVGMTRDADAAARDWRLAP